jgi:hypothetical protein
MKYKLLGYPWDIQFHCSNDIISIFPSTPTHHVFTDTLLSEWSHSSALTDMSLLIRFERSFPRLAVQVRYLRPDLEFSIFVLSDYRKNISKNILT